MSIVITPHVQSVAPQGATTATPVVLQPGSVISARVQQVLTSDIVRIAIGSQSIDVQSQVPLQAGQVLQLAVSQSADGTVRLAVLPPQDGAAASQAAAGGASAAATSDTVTLAPNAVASIAPQSTPAAVAPTIQLTVPEALAVSVAAQAAATQQTSLAPLFANLAVAAGLGNLPPQVQQAAAQLLAQRVSVDQGLTGNDIKQAFQSSGLFLEASLATGSPASGTPDMKAALIVLRQVLSNSLNGAAAPPNVTAPAATVTQGTASTAAAVPQATTMPAAAAPQGSATPSATVAPPATSTAQPVTASVVTTQGTAAAAVIIEQGTQPPVQVSSPSISTAAPETTATGSLAPEVVAAAVSMQGGAAATTPDVLDLGAANQTILPPATAADAAARTAASAAALNLLQEAVQSNPLTPFNMLNLSGLVLENGQMMGLLPAVAGGARAVNVDDGDFAHTNVPPPPIGGALPAAQPVLPATLVSNSSAESAMHRLLGDTDAAIARQTLLQVASLPDRADAAGARVDQAAARWNFEIPFATPQGTAMAQFEISRDGGGNEVAAAKRVWRARFSLDVEPAGPVHALVSLTGDKTSVRMWAERPATAAQLRAGAAQLSQALSRAELHPGDIIVRDGAPPQPAPARAGHFLDRAL
jgi:hypothetical protein